MNKVYEIYLMRQLGLNILHDCVHVLEMLLLC